MKKPSVRSELSISKHGGTKVEGGGDGYLPLRDLAAYSGLSVRTLRTYLVHRSCPLPYLHVGGKLLVKRSEFDSWINGFRVADPADVDAAVADALQGL